MRLLALALLLVVCGCGLENPLEVACTMEVKACQDGSYVGRDPGRNCEFRTCPR